MQQSGGHKLLRRYQAGEYTPEQQAMVVHRIIYFGIVPQNLLAMQPDLDELRSRTTGANIKTRKMIWPAGIVIVAASIAILLGVGTLILSHDNNQQAAYANDANPRSNTANLTLANGTTINLSDAKKSSLLNQLSIKCMIVKDSNLVYKVTSKSSTSGYNIITTPKGGQYKIVLSDGTRGQLNAASTLSYSISLKICRCGRKVNIGGDAYFESYGVIPSVKMQLEGEALFVRAFSYFYLTNLFGEIPLQLTSDYRVTSVAPKSSISQVYQQIVTDLQAAESKLLDNYPSNGRFRPNKSAAQALARVEHERRVELFSEWGHRWFDLKRTNRADDVLSTVRLIKSKYCTKRRLLGIT